ncbi:MAG: hypothetical protein DCC71_00565 [Proteobacteria bacterium]|nr:MAG: hypothetical protein DCC71_00565 [Pseudomonadota bacterium]
MIEPRTCAALAAALLALAAAGDARATTAIFLDRCSAGCAYTAGPDDARTNASSVVDATSVVSAFAHGDASWDAVVACVQDAFAPFDAVVTDVDPGEAGHLEIAVAGTPQQIGLPAGVGNVSPITCAGDRVIANGVAFAFANLLGDAPLDICWNAAQAAGALLGLDRVLLAADVMTYLDGPLPKQFLDETGDCGEDTPRTCQCGGTAQNSYQWLLATLPEPGALAAGGGALLALAAVARRH